MPEIRPFRGLRYNPSTIPIDEVVAPPYDVISVDQQQRLYERHPKNVVRLILGREEDRYASAARSLHDWLADGSLKLDEAPSIYLLHQSYEANPGQWTTRKGFVALCRVEEFEKKVVLPHEKTHAKPREDRFRLFMATHSNFSQIFSLYWDPEKRVDAVMNGTSRLPATTDVTFESVRNLLWRIDDPRVIGEVSGFLLDRQVLIADGHHRYETALAYRDAMRSRNPGHTGNEPYNYVMMFFSNIEDDGLAILPTHRVVHSLANFDAHTLSSRLAEKFLVREVSNLKALQTGLATASSRSFGFLLKNEGRLCLASLKPNLTAATIVTDDIPPEVKELDVTILHSLVIRDILGIGAREQEQKTNLDYVKSMEDAVSAVRQGSAQAAFLLNATRLEEVRNVSKAGHLMPQKSTYFFPKLVSGLVMNLMQSPGS